VIIILIDNSIGLVFLEGTSVMLTAS